MAVAAMQRANQEPFEVQCLAHALGHADQGNQTSDLPSTRPGSTPEPQLPFQSVIIIFLFTPELFSNTNSVEGPCTIILWSSIIRGHSNLKVHSHIILKIGIVELKAQCQHKTERVITWSKCLLSYFHHPDITGQSSYIRQVCECASRGKWRATFGKSQSWDTLHPLLHSSSLDNGAIHMETLFFFKRHVLHRLDWLSKWIL